MNLRFRWSVVIEELQTCCLTKGNNANSVSLSSSRVELSKRRLVDPEQIVPKATILLINSTLPYFYSG
ncbi:hypothetical protein RSOLAG1IB_11747 [Rhizoctonia solani AG-1 IB]|uniref:Uncharacterized protein n=1 Tax=Thanatephorus cucumeris (strain AG1-IB / isolate 7/3/14) TaxID=1108050 RepID=A0A0B7F9C2_THACB|nr:hypothetical protein RSOLAG1IB_11747 [Rhizoctonia solani AG-1 IB]